MGYQNQILENFSTLSLQIFWLMLALKSRVSSINDQDFARIQAMVLMYWTRKFMMLKACNKSYMYVSAQQNVSRAALLTKLLLICSNVELNFLPCETEENTKPV